MISFQYLNIPSKNCLGQSPFVETEFTLARLSGTRHITGYLMIHGIVGRAEIIDFSIILGHLLRYITRTGLSRQLLPLTQSGTCLLNWAA